MKILLTNDDGYNAKGVLALAESLVKAGHEVTVCAPLTEKSGAGHSITFINDFEYISHDLVKGAKVYSLNGTPVDCVRFGLFVIYPKAEIVLSGINNILNIGTDFIYSGTSNAAIEGTICNRKAIAFSTNAYDGNYDYPCEFIIKNLDTLLNGIIEGVTLNVNIPSNYVKDIKGIKVCPVGVRDYNDNYIPCVKDGKVVYHLLGEMVSKCNCDDIDDVTFSDKGYITITPIRHLTFDEKVISELAKKDFKL